MRTTSSWPRRSTSCWKSPHARPPDSPAESERLDLFSGKDRQDDPDDAGAGEQPARVLPEVLFRALFLGKRGLDRSLNCLEASPLARCDEKPRESDNDQNDAECAHESSGQLLAFSYQLSAAAGLAES